MRRAAPIRNGHARGGGQGRGRGGGRGVVTTPPVKTVVPLVYEPVKEVEVVLEPTKATFILPSPVTTMPKRLVFVAHCDLSDIIVPMPYILDFIQKYRYRYGEVTTQFFLSADSRYEPSIRDLYQDYVQYLPLLTYEGINPCMTEDQEECRVYCWRRHFKGSDTPLTPPPPPCNSLSSDFFAFYQDIFKRFQLGMSRNLGRYLPSVNATTQGHKKVNHTRALLARANPYNLPVAFFLNSDDDDALTSGITHRSRGTTHLNLFLQTFTSIFWVVSHRHPSVRNGSRDNLVFLSDLLGYPSSQPLTLSDFQATSVHARVTVTSVLGDIPLLTRLHETSSKVLLVVPTDENSAIPQHILDEAHPELGKIQLLHPNPFEAAIEMETFLS